MVARIERLLLALIFALLAAGITLVVASAQEGAPPPAQTSSSNCSTCHTEFEMTWQNGAHGKSGSDPIFLAEWEKQGKPGACLVCHTTGYDPATATFKEAGVTCESCHGPAPADHPKSPMPVDRSTDLCGRCHSDTRFGWQDWKVSTHYQRGMDCTTCHDPHRGTEVAYSQLKKPKTQVCVSCHQTQASRVAAHTGHKTFQATCTDCHTPGFFFGKPDMARFLGGSEVGLPNALSPLPVSAYVGLKQGLQPVGGLLPAFSVPTSAVASQHPWLNFKMPVSWVNQIPEIGKDLAGSSAAVAPTAMAYEHQFTLGPGQIAIIRVHRHWGTIALPCVTVSPR